MRAPKAAPRGTRSVSDDPAGKAAPGAIEAADRLIAGSTNTLPDVRGLEPGIVRSGHDAESIKPDAAKIRAKVENDRDAVLVKGDLPGPDGKPQGQWVSVEGFDAKTHTFTVRTPDSKDTKSWTPDDLKKFTKGPHGGEAVAITARPEHHATQREIDAIVNAAPANMREAARTAVPLILDAATRAGVTDRQQIAYMLATAQHESQLGHGMTEGGNGKSKDGVDHYFDMYNAGTSRGKDLGNTEPGDGERFKGRGYVQVTGRGNYNDWSKRLDLDLVKNPERMTVPDVAARAMVEGMREGTFRPGHKLDTYTRDKSPGYDYYDARGIVNADKGKVERDQTESNGERIAGYARKYEGALLKVEISEQLPRLAKAGTPLPEPVDVAKWKGDTRTGTFVKVDDTTYALQTARGQYVVFDTTRDLHGQAPPEGERMQVDTKGRLHEAPERAAQPDRTMVR